MTVRPPRRRPYPYDIIFNTHGLMLGSPDDKNPTRLVASKQQTLENSQPIQYGFEDLNPIHGRDQVYDDLSLGFGMAIQQQLHERRYSYTENGDASVSGFIMKGPDVQMVTPGTVDTANGIAKTLDYKGNTYAINGRYVLVRANDTTWNVSKDLGAGVVATDAIVITQNGTTNTYLLVGIATGFLWYFDGSTWTQHASLSGSYFTMWTTFLYVATAHFIRYVDLDADPLTEANYAPASPGYSIGDSTYAIKSIKTGANGGLFVVKQDGIYTLDANFIDRNLYPFLQLSPSLTFPPCAGNWMDDVYVGYQDAAFRAHVDWSVEEIGPERLVNNDSPVHGRVTAFCGHETFNLYVGLYNTDTSTSYLMKFGAWLNLQEPPDWIAPQATTAERIESWHGSITNGFAGKWITSLSKCSVGAPTGHFRLYLGFSDGSIGFFILPCTPNPAACSNYVFSADDGKFHLPRFHGMFQADAKALLSATVSGIKLDNDHYVELQYRTDANGQFLFLGQNTTGFGTYGNLAQYTYGTLTALTYLQLKGQAPGAVSWTQQRQIYDFPLQTGSVLTDFVIYLKTLTNLKDSPIVTGLSIRYAVRPRLRKVYEFFVLADEKCARRDGSPLRLTPRAIDDIVASAADSPGGIYMILPNEKTVAVGVVGYEASVAWDNRRSQWRSAIHVTAADFQLVENLAAVLGTYGRLGAVTYGQLSRLTYAEMRRI